MLNRDKSTDTPQPFRLYYHRLNIDMETSRLFRDGTNLLAVPNVCTSLLEIRSSGRLTIMKCKRKRCNCTVGFHVVKTSTFHYHRYKVVIGSLNLAQYVETYVVNACRPLLRLFRTDNGVEQFQSDFTRRLLRFRLW